MATFKLKGRRKRIGEGETGVVYEQAIEITDEQGATRMFRRVTVELNEPTRDGATEIHILTNLPTRIGALRIASLYRGRWTIETAFQEVAEKLEGEIETLGYPKAALFGFCMALISYPSATTFSQSYAPRFMRCMAKRRPRNCRLTTSAMKYRRSRRGCQSFWTMISGRRGTVP